MRGKLASLGRFLFVGVGIIILTSFGIDAADTITGSQTALGILAKKVTNSQCPKEMLEYQIGERKMCVDIYEVGVGESCLFLEPKSNKDTAINEANPKCQAVSKEAGMPWTFVALPQAKALCAKAGKRLPSALEWYMAALGTPDNLDVCNLSGGAVNQTGESPDCHSGVGAKDMIGNVWEWVDSDINDAMLDGRGLPLEGYVSEVDQGGVATLTSLSPSVVFNEDYFWAGSFGRYAMMRGGFYGSKSDGGLYAVHAKTEGTFASGAVGFRCVKDLD
jgi:formylglycine-generating enzyme required for sulfatase activity